MPTALEESDVSEYKRQRLVNIQENQTRLVALGIVDAKTIFKGGHKAPVTKAPVMTKPARKSVRLAVPSQHYNDAVHSRSPSRRRECGSSPAASGSHAPVRSVSGVSTAVAADAAIDAAPDTDTDTDTDADADAAFEAAQKLRISPASPIAVVVRSNLCAADVYVLASEGATLVAGVLHTGYGVRVEVSDGDSSWALDVPMPLTPTSDLPVKAAFFGRAGVWKLRWVLPARRRRAHKVACLSPRCDLPRR